METTPQPDTLSIVGFRRWMKKNEASPETTRIYCGLVERWQSYVQNSNLPEQEAWISWQAPSKQIRRLTGYALRRYATFQQDVNGKIVPFTVPQRLPRTSRPNPNPISDKDLIRLRFAMKHALPEKTSISLRVWLMLLDELGLRRNETPQNWRSFQFEDAMPTVAVSGKTGTRTLPLPPKLARKLRWLKTKRPTSPWIGAKGQTISPDTMYQQFKKAARSAGLDNIRPHHLRHRRLTKLCRSHLGSNQLLVLAIAGHQHVSSLQHYYKVSQTEMAEVLMAA